MFLYLRGSKPKRKVALAVNDAMAWTTFISQVRDRAVPPPRPAPPPSSFRRASLRRAPSRVARGAAGERPRPRAARTAERAPLTFRDRPHIAQVERKLRLPTGAVDAIQYARGGAPVSSVHMLQDIDELEVISSTVGGAEDAGAGAGPSLNGSPVAEMAQRHAGSNGGQHAVDVDGGGAADDDEDADKYEKRRTGLFNSMFRRTSSPARRESRAKRPLLPNGNDVGVGGKGRAKRGRGGCGYVQIAMLVFVLVWILGILIISRKSLLAAPSSP